MFCSPKGDTKRTFLPFSCLFLFRSDCIFFSFVPLLLCPLRHVAEGARKPSHTSLSTEGYSVRRWTVLLGLGNSAFLGPPAEAYGGCRAMIRRRESVCSLRADQTKDTDKHRRAARRAQPASFSEIDPSNGNPIRQSRMLRARTISSISADAFCLPSWPGVWALFPD